MIGRHANRRDPRESLGRAGIAGGESDHLAVFDRLQTNDIWKRQHGDQIQERPGILAKARPFQPAEGIEIQERGGLDFHRFATSSRHQQEGLP